MVLENVKSYVLAYTNDDFLNLDHNVWHQRYPRLALKTNDQLICQKPNIYICEEPPDAVPPFIDNTCNYRNVAYHEQIYRWVAGRGCLQYTPNFLYINGSNPINLGAGCIYGDLFAPCLEVVKQDGNCACYPFDPAFEEVAAAVRNAVVPAAQGRWEKCFYEASDCCSHYMNKEDCATTFDGWTCWLPGELGTTAYAVFQQQKVLSKRNVGDSD
ncbi:unnamed protein product [Leptidea sinapis]|uniref:G-protein coupled receptors family 2 profile 1 domain-containing protein n=1 Tax=Leptidea sinapis TaxID=189913 RepID=A0A5E4QVV9_9NEOP|nr:unnamed protein product [Leptidea sinapis]